MALEDIKQELLYLRKQNEGIIEHVADMSAHLRMVIGNGQPGRLQLVEVAVKKLERQVAYRMGAIAAGSAILGGSVEWVLMRVLR